MAGHCGIKRSRQLVLAEFEPGEFAVVADPVEVKTQLAKRFFALLDLADTLGGDLDAVLDTRTQASRGGTVPGG